MAVKSENSKKKVKKTKTVSVKSKAIKSLKSEVKEIKKDLTKKTKTVAVEHKKNQEKVENLKELPKVATVEMEKSITKTKLGVLSNGIARATGHRKRAIAKVSCSLKGKKNLSIEVNGIDYQKYFTKLIHRDIILSPLKLLNINNECQIKIAVLGGGKTGQADASKLGLSKCLAILSEENAKILRKNSFLTRDTRIVEPKKYGLKKARKKEQFSKR